MLHHILGMRVKRNSDKTTESIILIDQHVYINDKLKLFNMNECK